MDDPLFLLMQGVWLLAAGMYPLGFLFGACSACCGCACGSRVPNFDFATANALAKRREDNADWCCSGSPPQEITIRVSDAVSQASGVGVLGDKVTPFCDQVEGDYVLTLRKFAEQCVYQYEPSCEFECPEREYDEDEDEFLDPPIPLFLAGIGVAAYPAVPNAGAFQAFGLGYGGFATQFIEGQGYEFGVTLYGYLNPGVDFHCGVYWGIPAEVEDLSPNNTGRSQTTNGPEPILVGGHFHAAQQFEESKCDMRGHFSDTVSSSIGFSTINASHFFGTGIFSLSDCDAVVSQRHGTQGTFALFSDAAYADLATPAECQWDVEILPP
jgi:hypothetical protein